MSTDLDIQPNLLIPAIIDHSSCAATAGVIDHRSTEVSKPIVNPPQQERKTKEPKKDDISNTNNNDNNNKTSGDGDEEDDPLTPTSDEFKIPAPRSPPPAPRKRRCGVAVACRKKLDFIDHMNHPQLIIPKEEVIQEFFNSSFDQIHSRRLLKRRCPCI